MLYQQLEREDIENVVIPNYKKYYTKYVAECYKRAPKDIIDIIVGFCVDDIHGFTLIQTVCPRYSKLFFAFIKHGARVFNINNLLTTAAMFNCCDIMQYAIRYLLTMDVDGRWTYRSINDALLTAVDNNNFDIVRLLFEFPIDVKIDANYDNGAILRCAIRYCDQNVVKYLLELPLKRRANIYIDLDDYLAMSSGDMRDYLINYLASESADDKYFARYDAYMWYGIHISEYQNESFLRSLRHS
jgi:hypothetical protein